MREWGGNKLPCKDLRRLASEGSGGRGGGGLHAAQVDGSQGERNIPGQRNDMQSGLESERVRGVEGAHMAQSSVFGHPLLSAVGRGFWDRLAMSAPGTG